MVDVRWARVSVIALAFRYLPFCWSKRRRLKECPKLLWFTLRCPVIYCAVIGIACVPRKVELRRFRLKDKRDRATNERALDPQTRMILFKMIKPKSYHCCKWISESSRFQARFQDFRQDFKISCKISRFQ